MNNSLLHICFITSEYPSIQKPEGGLGNYIRKVSLAIIERGHQVSVFVLGSRYYDDLDHGVQLHYVKRMRFHWRLHAIKKLHLWLVLVEERINAKRLKNAVLSRHCKEQIDILQTPNYKAPGLGLCCNDRFPVVCRCSSYQPLLRSANGGQKRLPDAISDYFEARQLIDANAAFSPSQFIAKTYERLEGVKPEVIRTPIKISQFKEDESKYQKHFKGMKYLLYFGVLNGIKGVDVLIEAIPAILTKHEEIKFVFVGRNAPLPDGNRACDVIKKDLYEFLSENRFIYFPSLPQEQLFPIIKNAVGLVMPSRVDNYPNACLEALSVDVPVVGTYNSSLDEMIENGRTGFLAKNGDLLSLIRAIESLFDQDLSERKCMIENIQQEVARIVREDRVGQLIQFYKDTIEKFDNQL